MRVGWRPLWWLLVGFEWPVWWFCLLCILTVYIEYLYLNFAQLILINLNIRSWTNFNMLVCIYTVRFYMYLCVFIIIYSKVLSFTFSWSHGRWTIPARHPRHWHPWAPRAWVQSYLSCRVQRVRWRSNAESNALLEWLNVPPCCTNFYRYVIRILLY